MGDSSPKYWRHAEPQSLLTTSAAPLAGVLLSVLALWIMAMPAPAHVVAIDISGSCPSLIGPDPVVHTVVVDFDGVLYWDGETLAGPAELDTRLRAVGAEDKLRQADVHIKPHKLASYRAVVAVMAAAQRNGVVKMGVIGETSFMSDMGCLVCRE